MQQQREVMNLSILDFVREQATEINRVVSAADRRRMDEYLTSIRDIERRIQAPPPNLPANAANGMQRPTRVPTLFREHFRLMADMLVLALQTDMTRVATLVMGTEGNRRSYPELGFTEEHHGVSHHAGNPELSGEIHQDQRTSRRRNGLFHRPGFERAGGRGLPLGQLHDRLRQRHGRRQRPCPADIPTLLFGKGGGTIDPGRHVVCPTNTPICNLWLSLMDRMGVEAERFGDSTGRLTLLNA